MMVVALTEATLLTENRLSFHSVRLLSQPPAHEADTKQGLATSIYLWHSGSKEKALSPVFGNKVAR